MDYIYQLVNFIKHWSSYFGFPSRQNFEYTFYQLLHDKEYDEAIKLTEQHNYLDIDLVYKCKWRNSGITVQSIHSNLGKIQDKLWAINECVQTVPISYEACRTLIEFGLKEANLKLLYQLGNDSPLYESTNQDDEIEGLIDFDNLNEQQKELCWCRQDLMRHEHSLFAYESILGDYRIVQQQFEHTFYDEFRQKCPFNACIDYAHEGDAHAVETMLNFYTEDLSPHLLAILSNIPETLSPYQYRNLLPCLREGEIIYEWRAITGRIKSEELDWSNRGVGNSSFILSLKDIGETYEREFYSENEYLKKFFQPLTADLLSQWYVERSLEIESRTLLLSSAIQLLHLGSELNIKNLQETKDNLVEFSRIVYDCCTENIIYFSFSEFTIDHKRQGTQLSTMASQTMALGDFNGCYEVCQLIIKKNHKDCWAICCQLGMHKQFNNLEAKYKLLAFALAYCDDPDGKTSTKILNYVIEMRKRDETIQLAYLQHYM